MQPQPFGLYTLINRINVGGMAEVFKACYYDEGRPAFAAIKRILPHLAQDQAFIEMFITEAHTAGRLIHPNIAQIIEQGEEEGEYFISMEYVSGRDLLYLRHHLRERGMYFPPALAALVVTQIASALDYAHRLCDNHGQHLEIIHRDVSPQNILISFDGEVKLIDFGIAKAKVRSHQHTRAGVLKGKFGYMAPEQVKGLTIDHRADIFALGTVFHELLTNQRLFMGESDIETIELVRQAKVQPPSQLNEWVPPMLDQIVLRALSVDPQSRYQTAADMANDLAQFIQSEAPMTHASTLKTWMNQEFSTFIAHEKAQDAYLIDQMEQNLVVDDDDGDSTSLIGSDVIEQLNQYTASEFGRETLHEEDTGPIHMNDVDTGPMDFHQEWAPASDDLPQQNTAPPSNIAPPHSDQSSHLDQPPTRRVSAEMFQELNHLKQITPIQPSHVSFTEGTLDQISSFSSSVTLPQQIETDHEEQLLEDLLEEDFEDDESGLIEKADLDQILSLSINQGGTSPLPDIAHSTVPFSSSPSSPLPPYSAPSQEATLRKPSIASTTKGHFTALSPEPEAPQRQLFDQNEPTPIPEQLIPHRRSRGSKTSRPFRRIILSLLLLAGIVASAWYLFIPQTSLVTFKIQPNNAFLQLGEAPPTQVSGPLQLELSGQQSFTIRHPDFPIWTGFFDPKDQSEPYTIEIDLEKRASHALLIVESNVNDAEVWVLGRKRGVTPFKGQVPTTVKGEVLVRVIAPGRQPKRKRLRYQSKTPLRFYVSFP